MKYAWTRKRSILINNLKRYFQGNKTVLIYFSVIFLVGFLTGIFVAIKNSNGISIDYICKNTLVRFMKKEVGGFKYLFTCFISLGLLSIFIYIASRFRVCFLLYTVLIALISYKVGVCLFAIMIIYGFQATLSLILVVLPFKVLEIYLIIFQCSCAIRRCICIKRCGRYYVSNKEFFGWLWFLVPTFVLCLLETLLLNLIIGTFIFVI